MCERILRFDPVRLEGSIAEVDKATPFGTPLSEAAQRGHEKCAALLRAAGAKDVR